MERLIGSLGRDLAFLRLPELSPLTRTRLTYQKYRLHWGRAIGLAVKKKFQFNGRTYHVSSSTDGGLLQRVILDTHDALVLLGVLGECGVRALDVGAHNGETILAWSLFLETPEIYAFEPDLVSFDNARANTEGLTASLEAVGLSNQTGTCGFDVSRGHGGDATFALKSGAPGTTVEAKVARGDDLFEGMTFDLIKIDVEGYERHVLEGLRETLGRSRCLVIEMSLQRPKDHSFHEIARILADSKFELIGTSKPHGAARGVQTAIDLYFRRATNI